MTKLINPHVLHITGFWEDFFFFLLYQVPVVVCWPYSNMGLIVSTCRLSCPVVCGILVPWPEIKPASPALESRVITNGPLGKSLRWPILLFLFCRRRERGTGRLVSWSRPHSKEANKPGLQQKLVFSTTALKENSIGILYFFLKQAKYLVSFHSGPWILNEVLGTWDLILTLPSFWASVFSFETAFESHRNSVFRV